MVNIKTKKVKDAC